MEDATVILAGNEPPKKTKAELSAEDQKRISDIRKHAKSCGDSDPNLMLTQRLIIGGYDAKTACQHLDTLKQVGCLELDGIVFGEAKGK
jgi:hypothetical protein